MALAVVLATLLSLSVLIGVLFITAGRSRRPSLTEATEVGERERIEIGVSVPWRTGRRRRQQHSRLGAAVASHTTHKDAVKLGWVPAEDFDQWSQTLFHQTETEHERLLLAVSPHQWKCETHLNISYDLENRKGAWETHLTRLLSYSMWKDVFPPCFFVSFFPSTPTFLFYFSVLFCFRFGTEKNCWDIHSPGKSE